MNGTRSEVADGALMLGRGVSFVARETVSGILRIQLRHQAIAIDLRHNRSCGDREVNAIAFIETVLGLREAWHRAARPPGCLARSGPRGSCGPRRSATARDYARRKNLRLFRLSHRLESVPGRRPEMTEKIRHAGIVTTIIDGRGELWRGE